MAVEDGLSPEIAQILTTLKNPQRYMASAFAGIALVTLLADLIGLFLLPKSDSLEVVVYAPAQLSFVR
jgi:hypothetical protein